MSKERKRSKGQRLFILLGALAFGLILFFARDTISDTVDVLKEVNLRILFLLPVLQFVAYIFIAGYYRSALKLFDHNIGFLRAYGTVVSLYFIEQVLPSGGVSGMSYIAYALRTVASVGLTTIVQISRYLLNYAAYIVLVPIGLIMLLIDDNANQRAIWLGVGLIVGLLIGGFIIKYLLEAQSHIDRFVKIVGGFVNRVAKRFFSREQLIKPEAIKTNLVDFHDGALRLLRNGTKILRPYAFMVMASSMQLTIVYLAYYAVGETLNPGIIIVAFTVANIVGAISIIPGDVGVHEAAIVLVLSWAGVGSDVAIAGTLLYRVFNKLIVLPIGFIVYTQFLKPQKEAKENAK